MLTQIAQITFTIYVVGSVLLTLYTVAIMGFEDYEMHRDKWKRSNSKFGYNYNSGLSWIMVCSCLPIINFIVIILWLLATFAEKRK